MRVVKKSVLTFDKNCEPEARVQPGELLVFKTQDCFAGQITKESQLISELDLTKCNPAAGPVYVEGAEPGDVLAVDLLDIRIEERGFVCSMGEVGPLHEVSELRTCVIPIENETATYKGIQWLVEPMVGVIGTAPAGEDAIPCGFAASHGGNLDSRVIKKGARVYFPVRVPGALLQMGDLHASMGDGEICGTGIEVSGEVTVRTELIKGFELHWPVTETGQSWYVNAVEANYDAALLSASRELARLVQRAYGWDATDCNIYFSIRGMVEINQGIRPIHDEMFVLRMGVPKVPGKPPLVGG
ncbi:acetamidase/formamidase family protein [Ruminococcaceae bacterium OttesenSCG-928-I18]|nr:acetamidase/formamidase family protein [Ruminococcaceae bacterium OttesenSCG-928-I18]